MNIWGIKAEDHDGSLCEVLDGELISLKESEKLGGPRFADLTPLYLLEAQRTAAQPDGIALSCVHERYFGIDRGELSEQKYLGRDIIELVTAHERSHVLCSYAMSPYSGEEAYCLVWEGTVGTIYEVSPDLSIRRLSSPMSQVGKKYRGIYNWVAQQNGVKTQESGTEAGTLMALLALSDGLLPDEFDQDRIMKFADERRPIFPKEGQKNSPQYEGLLIGADLKSQRFLRSAKFLSDYIFESFYAAAKKHCRKSLPLVISGGCGYNCDWNTMWRNTNLFTGVFVPPVTGDPGVSIGAAIDLQHAVTGSAALRWDVFSGPDFIDDAHNVSEDWVPRLVSPYMLASIIALGHTVPVAYGKAEIGPRALGHRSILIDPTREDCQGRMNTLKKRQSFRPVAPICLEEDVSNYFDWAGPSPYMLYFQQVKDPRLVGVRHVDGTARLQTVTKESDQFMYDLLKEFKVIRGVSCLANSSLNFPGMGFITSTSSCARFAEDAGLKYFVAGDNIYTNRSSRVE
jgi:predicted NodU family carbamoyl transferase